VRVESVHVIMSGRRSTVALALLGLLIGCAFPAAARAHGPVAPIASDYLARLTTVPQGLNAKVVDGDLRMWLANRSGEPVVVLDYRGAPYLRFSRSGVYVNQNSEMYYLNQTPVAWAVPANLTATTPPKWSQVSGGNTYEWHDGRLHALAAVALSPDSSYVGHWRIPVLVAGRPTMIAGGLWHADRPSLVWFWPIVVLLACVVAGWRLRRVKVDALTARGLATAALIATAVASAAHDLHGRPNVAVFGLITFVAVLVFVAWGLRRVLLSSPGWFFFFVISAVAIWEGVQLVPTLRDGFVLAAVPAFIARVSAVVCLGCGLGLLLLVFRLAERPEREPSDRDDPATEFEDEDLGAYA
jgi:hypothetical protein